MLSENRIKELYEFAKETLINFYSITPECTHNDRLESIVKVYEIVLEIPEKDRIAND